MSDKLKGFEEVIGYTFKQKRYLQIAMTHSSYANELKKGMECNERQEFLGDSVLSVITSDYLFRTSGLKEGELTRLRASIVCEKSLCAFAQQINIGERLSLGKGEEQTGGASRPSILADAFESLIAAIYLDGGMEKARGFVVPFIENILEDKSMFRDYKTALQEIIQQNPQETLSYALIDEIGPDHEKIFVVEVRLNSNVIGKGEDRSKKGAEQLAAKQALELMGR